MKIRRILLGLIVLILLVESGIFLNFTVFSYAAKKTPSGTVGVKKVSSQISADGTITAQNQAMLHFQTGGKLAYLPLKEGDKVTAGQTVAQLDSYALQKSLQLAANTYQVSKNNNAQIQENNQANVVEGQQRVSLDTTNKNSYNNITEAQVITDAVKRIVDNSSLSQDSAQLNVDLANYAVQLATLTSPLTGIVTHEDVTVAGVNVIPTTSFVVADPSSVVFRANISANDIDYVAEGAQATIIVDGSQKRIKGTVLKIYPSKITLANGQAVYQVDIQSDDLKNAKLDQSGTVLITSSADQNVTLVPTWTILSGKYIWVNHDGTTELKQIKIGRVHGDQTEVLNGLTTDDNVITDPKSLPSKKYLLL
ncbi:MAG TPA: HlyD family efflux transporter periplasmic adaptor subunit [Methylomirabilota bacterium]|nr:HlyD family efflux transporter periplasmic adaptor subunit [Methylomirabilota bacterium]